MHLSFRTWCSGQAAAGYRYLDVMRRETPDTYVHGHHESVLRSHTQRTVENSAAYLMPHLAGGLQVLDVGCGPGTISTGIAGLVAPGQVIAIDAEQKVIDHANELAGPQTNCRFETGDVYSLNFPDNTFDVVHAHQLLQHLTDPVAALTEMRRVTKPGGVVGARDTVYAAMSWSPADPLFDRWMELYHEITAHNRVEPNAGKELFGWAQKAGFSAVTASSSAWTFATGKTRLWWGSLWAERVQQSTFAQQALEHHFSTRAELSEIAAAFLRWANDETGFFMAPHGEVTAVK